MTVKCKRPPVRGATPQTSTTDGARITRTSSSVQGGDTYVTTTTRTCSGSGCWCHTGAAETATIVDVSYYWDWRQRMDSTARAIRALEVSEGIRL